MYLTCLWWSMRINTTQKYLQLTKTNEQSLSNDLPPKGIFTSESSSHLITDIVIAICFQVYRCISLSQQWACLSANMNIFIVNIINILTTEVVKLLLLPSCIVKSLKGWIRLQTFITSQRIKMSETPNLNFDLFFDYYGSF